MLYEQCRYRTRATGRVNQPSRGYAFRRYKDRISKAGLRSTRQEGEWAHSERPGSRVVGPALVAVGRVSMFLRGGDKEVGRIARTLTRSSVGVRTFDVSRAASFNVLHLIISSMRGTIGMLRRGRFTIVLASMMYVDYPGMPNSLTRVVRRLARRSVFVRCVCTFTRNSGTGIIVHPASLRHYLTMLRRGRYYMLSGAQLWPRCGGRCPSSICPRYGSSKCLFSFRGRWPSVYGIFSSDFFEL